VAEIDVVCVRACSQVAARLVGEHEAAGAQGMADDADDDEDQRAEERAAETRLYSLEMQAEAAARAEREAAAAAAVVEEEHAKAVQLVRTVTGEWRSGGARRTPVCAVGAQLLL
jgi:hypothetical protein